MMFIMMLARFRNDACEPDLKILMNHASLRNDARKALLNNYCEVVAVGNDEALLKSSKLTPWRLR